MGDVARRHERYIVRAMYGDNIVPLETAIPITFIRDIP